MAETPASQDSGDTDPPGGDPPGAIARPRSTGRRSLLLALATGVVGAALVLYAVGRTWARGEVAVGADRQALFTVSVEGSEVTAVPGALALVGLAALVAVFAVRRAGRLAVAALLALSGAVTAVTAGLGATDSSALDDEAATASGLADAAATSVTHTAWPWLAVAGGALLLLSGVVALVRGGDWPGMSSRYEVRGGRRTRRRRSAAPEGSADLWQALDRGEDPTDR